MPQYLITLPDDNTIKPEDEVHGLQQLLQDDYCDDAVVELHNIHADPNPSDANHADSRP